MIMGRWRLHFNRSFWSALFAILSSLVTQSALALQLPKAIEVRLIKSSVETAIKSAYVQDDTLPVIESTTATHLWLSAEIENGVSDEFLRILTTMRGSRREARSRPEVYFGQLKSNVAINAFGFASLFNIELLGQQGRLQRIDLGVLGSGNLYVHAIKLVDGRILTPVQIYSAFATVPQQPIELRFLKVAQEAPAISSSKRGLKFVVLETSQLSWLLMDHLSAPAEGDDAIESKILMVQTTSDKNREYAPWQTAMERGRVGSLAVTNFYGPIVLQNLEKMVEWGLLRRIDFGVLKNGGLYVHAVQLQSGETLTQQEIALALAADNVRGHNEGEPLVNFYFAQMVLAKKSSSRFMVPLARMFDPRGEEAQSRENTYIDFPSFAEALAFDRADNRPSK